MLVRLITRKLTSTKINAKKKETVIFEGEYSNKFYQCHKDDFLTFNSKSYLIEAIEKELKIQPASRMCNDSKPSLDIEKVNIYLELKDDEVK